MAKNFVYLHCVQDSNEHDWNFKDVKKKSTYSAKNNEKASVTQ